MGSPFLKTGVTSNFLILRFRFLVCRFLRFLTFLRFLVCSVTQNLEREKKKASSILTNIWHMAQVNLAKTSLAKWLSFRLRTKWFCVRIPLLSLKLQIWHLLRTRSSLTFRQTIDCRFTLKLVRDMITTDSQPKIGMNISTKTFPGR